VTISVSDEVYGERDSRDFTASGYLIEAGYAAASALLAELIPSAATNDRAHRMPWSWLKLPAGAAVAAGNGSA
jgi:hypothetical protein